MLSSLQIAYKRAYVLVRMHGGHEKQDAERAAARGEQVPSKPTRCRRAKKAREAVEAEGATAWGCTPTILTMVILAMVSLVVLALGLAPILVVLGTSGVGCGVHGEPLPNVDARTVPALPHSQHCAF